MMNTFKIICFPYAGGSKYSYRVLQTVFPSHVALFPIDYPGRGARIKENLNTSLEAIAEDAFNTILPELHKGPYAIYGHSMGALVGYLVTRKIVEHGLSAPAHLFITGRSGPAAPKNREPLHGLPRDRFLEKVKELGGLPGEICDNADLMDFFEPVLRADFKALETFNYTPKGPIDIPVSVIIGLQESITTKDARAWEQETTAPLDLRQFPGNHFFIFDHPQHIAEWMVRKISGLPVMNGAWK
ncbi:thioesterase II family protein [Sinomicrobium weinanense]|uniref:Thioesterase n=1 Tax=Sinomicrobium weinanense TaxID=2842200 RepID=A0A926Q2S8_9FLAO|nr:alpha/beta fold hydrolase [Sinomicrobium weinanense]MBC9795251.1 thioesterase [Sinomicrobium weinanense]MBU3125723.1 alpha/beta fold hydrolase [Sinomicrobium weinanense]